MPGTPASDAGHAHALFSLEKMSGQDDGAGQEKPNAVCIPRTKFVPRFGTDVRVFGTVVHARMDKDGFPPHGFPSNWFSAFLSFVVNSADSLPRCHSSFSANPTKA